MTLWITDPAAPPARPTQDVDAIIEVATRADAAGVFTPIYERREVSSKCASTPRVARSSGLVDLDSDMLYGRYDRRRAITSHGGRFEDSSQTLRRGLAKA